MSGSTSAGPLTAAELVAVRRFCGYGPPRAGQIDVVAIAIAGLTQDYIDVVRTSFLTNLYLLEGDIPATRQNLDTAEAAVWKHNPRELEQRRDLYRDTRLGLCGTLGIDSGPFLNLQVPAGFVV